MKLLSLSREQDRLSPVEVEVFLLPGLPTIHILGRPDDGVRECLHRVRSALRAQGFEWPKARQVLVNIRPVDRRKTSRGLELAIAAGLLWETGQRTPPATTTGRLFVYGELTLAGEVLEPEDLARDFFPEDGDVVLTGAGQDAREFPRERVINLADLDRPVFVPVAAPRYQISRPTEGLHRSFTATEARLLAITALGGFHLLLAGASGAGKSTLARSLRSFLVSPSAADLKQGRVHEGWRPWVAPHHSATALTMIGGGVPPRPGEISQADGGILFLDELLEFSTAVQEALREPVESGSIRVSRGFRSTTFPARIQLVATTNLCPCGRWSPGARISCGHSWRRCRSTLERISGPFFDRFDLLAFAEGKRAERQVPGVDVLEQVERARSYRASKPILDTRELWASIPEPWRSDFLGREVETSERRRLSTLRVARAIADLEQKDAVAGPHFEEALEWTFRSFEKLRQSGGV